MPRWPKRRPNSIVIKGRVLHLRPFCRKHGLGYSYVSKIINGKSPLDRVAVGKALIIANALNCTIPELIDLIEARRAATAFSVDPAPTVLNTPA